MRKLLLQIMLGLLCFAAGCSPRDFLTRRLAGELISASDGFKATQRFWLRTGVISNRDYLSPQYLVLQRHGWIAGTNAACPAEISPPPCWDVVLTPLGVEAFRTLMQNNAAPSSYFSVPAARRQLVTVTGIIKDGQVAEADFSWRWAPLNEVGVALYGENVEYHSTVGFRHYDDGWRVIQSDQPKRYPSMDDALRDSEAAR
jgi:hypothetical protein